MAIKGTDQITVVDLTDAYGVTLSCESHNFPGSTNAAKAGSVTTMITALRGSEVRPASVILSELTIPSGVTVTKDTDTTTPTLTISVGTSVTSGGVVKIPVHVDDVTIVKDFSFAIAFTGATGTAATSVVCGSEAQTIACDKDGKVLAETTITIPFAGYVGTARAACTLADPTLPSGMTKKSNTAATASADGSLVLTAAKDATLGNAAQGEITLSFSCNGQSFVKKFSWAKALTGATGAKGDQGNTGTAATSVVCGNEAVSLPCTTGGLVKSAQTVTIPFAGYIGTARAACTAAYSTLPSGMTLNKNTAATASADGSLIFNVAANATLGGASVYTGEITLTFTCNGQSFVKKFTWSKALTGATGEKGDQGDPGEDAVTLVILSSNGMIFKNSAIETTLTAHVYQAGQEVTGSALSALGTVKWYKDGGSTAVATGTSLIINAGDVTDRAVYEARLEA